MQLHIVLDDNPKPEQVTKALQVILMLSGIPTMQAAVKALGEVFAETEDGAEENDDENRGAAPLAPPPPPPANVTPAAEVVRDSSNLPWDARIHSSKKTTNKDGSWKAKKNVEAAVVAAVEAELRAIPGNAAPAAAPAPAPVAPPPPPPPANNAPPPPPPASGGNIAATTFVEIMQKISGGLTAGKLDQAKVSAALASVGLKQPLDLNAHPQQIPAVNAYLDAVMM